jgi:hypothetical protein
MLSSRFQQTGDSDDLQQAILQVEQAVAVTPMDHPHRATWLNSLRIILYLRFKRTGDSSGLQRAILEIKEAAAAFPLDYPDRGSVINNLGHMFSSTHKLTGKLHNREKGASQDSPW